jgi:hypothetical protein
MPTVFRGPASNSIEYLVRRKFPGSHAPPPMGTGAEAHARWEELMEAITAFRAALLVKKPEELAALVSQEREIEGSALLVKAQREEAARFFNQPHATADFEHWSKCAHWTLDEAVALSFGRSPETVSWDKIRSCEAISQFVQQYARRRDLALRAMAWRLLFDPVLPGIFLAWAKRTEIDVPPELVHAVEARGVVVADWKEIYETVKRDRDALATRVAELEAAAIPSEQRETKSAATQRIRTLQKLVLAMARAKYHWNPESRNKATGDKEGSIYAHVIDMLGEERRIDPDTIREVLNEAAAEFPKHD